jgi:hypothetical protein
MLKHLMKILGLNDIGSRMTISAERCERPFLQERNLVP